MKFFVIFVLWSFSLFASAQANLKFVSKRVVNIEHAKPNSLIKSTIEFINDGVTPLVILSVGKSCNCTNVNLSKTTIKPGDKGQVEVVIDTKGKSGHNRFNVGLKTNTVQKDYFIILNIDVDEL